MTYGEPARETALALLAGSVRVINQGCLGQVPEIADGNTPHIARGCGAQAWGITELHRVLAILTHNA
jgi:starch synthase (maltosyl-transferring)